MTLNVAELGKGYTSSVGSLVADGEKYKLTLPSTLEANVTISTRDAIAYYNGTQNVTTVDYT